MASPGHAEHPRVTLRCPAKVNLALSVGPLDHRGLHPIASWMVAVDLGDTLTVRRADDDRDAFNVRFAATAPQPQEVDWPIDNDLGFRAHRLMEDRSSRRLPVHVELLKRIPTGAGLGGGSSDAAAMLVALSRLFSLPAGEDPLADLGHQLGSDVPFLIAAQCGKPSAIVTGLGERVDPAPINGSLDLILILPPWRCPTGQVYARFDELGGTCGESTPDEARVRALATQGSVPRTGPFNDLTTPAIDVVPELGEALRRVRDALHWPVHVTGSGSAMFIIAPSTSAAEALARRVTQATGLPAVATRTLACGPP